MGLEKFDREEGRGEGEKKSKNGEREGGMEREEEREADIAVCEVINDLEKFRNTPLSYDLENSRECVE